MLIRGLVAISAVFASSAALAATPEPTANRFAPVGAFLNAHCVECHGGKSKKADLALNVYKDEVSILKDRKLFEQALEMVQEGEMPPPKRPRPSDAEVSAFVHGVHAMFDAADRLAKPDPGHVTVRRLNKVEYNNTIRDLVGVDFEPAEDFPSDDIGHGFDNIGDVLSISPVLMERYLAAAENITNAAIVVDPPKPPVRKVNGRNLEPNGRNTPQGKFRPLTFGALNLPQGTMPDGDYVLHCRAYAPKVGAELAKIAFMADGKELKQFEVKGEGEQQAYVTELKLKLDAGQHRIGVALLNPGEGLYAVPRPTTAPTTKPATRPVAAKDAKDPKATSLASAVTRPTTAPSTRPSPTTKRTVYVEFLSLEGPADTRPATQRKLLAVKPGQLKIEQTREVLQRFATRAYRRPATKDEVDRLVRFVVAAEARGDKWEAGIQQAMQAVLVSPKFLFRVELDDRPTSSDPHPLDEYQLASRLSYFLWATMPDDELFALAGKGQLTANLEAQVKRMLKDPRASKSLVDRFAMQWLQLQRLKGVSPDPKLFPRFDDRLRAAMATETEMFLKAIIDEDRSILDLIAADFTFMNGTLARHYGVVDTVGNTTESKTKRPGGKSIPDRGRFGGFGPPGDRSDFVRVTFPPDAPRGGLLTQASVLTVTSNPTRTSPVKRGRWVLEQILGAPPPPPPPNVPELDNQKKTSTAATLRQRMEEHRANPACANCHAKMDPIGFAFENFDAVGAFRQKDDGLAIDASGTLPGGRSFNGPAELKTILKERKAQVARCLTEKLLTYALGRGVEYYDRRAVEKITAALEKDDYRFSTLVIEVVKSDPFRLRRGREQQDKS